MNTLGETKLLNFTPLSETTSSPDLFKWESPPPPPPPPWDEGLLPIYGFLTGRDLADPDSLEDEFPVVIQMYLPFSFQ